LQAWVSVVGDSISTNSRMVLKIPSVSFSSFCNSGCGMVLSIFPIVCSVLLTPVFCKDQAMFSGKRLPMLILFSV